MKKIHPAFYVCAACAILLFTNMGLTVNSFSIYMSYLISICHYTNAQVSALTTVRSALSLISTFMAAYYYKKLGMKKGMFLSGIFVVMAFLLYSVADRYLICVLAASFAGIGYGFGTMVPIGIMLDRWFAIKKGTATGICTCITGLSTFGIPSLVARNIEKNSLSQTFRIEGIIIFLAVLIAFFLLKESPEKAGVLPYGYDRRDEEITKGKVRKNTNKKVTPVPFIIPLLTAAYTSAGYAHLSVLVTSEGHAPSSAAMILLGSGLAVTVSKFLFGRLSETISTYYCNLLFGGISFLGMIMILLFHGNLLLLGCGIVLFSAGLGMSTVGLVIWASDLSAEGEFEKLNHRYQTGFSLGALMFSFVPGAMADYFHGSYIPAFFLLTICLVIVIITVTFIYKRNEAAS